MCKNTLTLYTRLYHSLIHNYTLLILLLLLLMSQIKAFHNMVTATKLRDGAQSLLQVHDSLCYDCTVPKGTPHCVHDSMNKSRLCQSLGNKCNCTCIHVLYILISFLYYCCCCSCLGWVNYTPTHWWLGLRRIGQSVPSRRCRSTWISSSELHVGCMDGVHVRNKIMIM